MAKRILDYDPLTKMTTTFDYIPETDTTVIYREQEDVNLILDQNKVAQNDPGLWRDGVKQSWALYCHVPNIVIEHWLNTHGVNFYDKDHQKAVFKLLNRPEYKYLKTTTKMHWG